MRPSYVHKLAAKYTTQGFEMSNSTYKKKVTHKRRSSNYSQDTLPKQKRVIETKVKQTSEEETKPEPYYIEPWERRAASSTLLYSGLSLLIETLDGKRLTRVELQREFDKHVELTFSARQDVAKILQCSFDIVFAMLLSTDFCHKTFKENSGEVESYSLFYPGDICEWPNSVGPTHFNKFSETVVVKLQKPLDLVEVV